MKTFTIKEIAEYLEGDFSGPGETCLEGIKSLKEAKATHLSFLSSPRHSRYLEETEAGAVIVGRSVQHPTLKLIHVDDPHLAFVEALRLFYEVDRGEFRGMSPQAWVMEGAVVSDTASVGPGVYVGRGAVVGEEVVLFPGVFLGEEVGVEAGSVLFPGVKVYRRCVIGKRVIIHCNSVIGSDSLGYVKKSDKSWYKILQVGRVVIEDDVEIGSNVSIDRATFGDAVIGRGTKIDNQVEIAHNAQIGSDCVLVSQVGISGSVRIGDRVTFAGRAGTVGHVMVASDTVIGARATVTKDIRKEGQHLTGFPAGEHTQWLELQAFQRRLPKLFQRVRELEGKLREENR